jgi:hypothetical protein
MRVDAAARVIEERTLDRVLLFDWARTRTTSQCAPGAGERDGASAGGSRCLTRSAGTFSTRQPLDITMFSGLTAANQASWALS